jgi:hypothetical protein
MNVQKVKAGTVAVFFAFLVPVLNHGFWAVASTVQNAGRMVGDNNVVLEHIVPKADLIDFIRHMPWALWVYFVAMLGIGVCLIVSGWKREMEGRIEQVDGEGRS